MRTCTGSTPARCAMFEDSMKNIKASKSLGMTTVLLLKGNVHHEHACSVPVCGVWQHVPGLPHLCTCIIMSTDVLLARQVVRTFSCACVTATTTTPTLSVPSTSMCPSAFAWRGSHMLGNILRNNCTLCTRRTGDCQCICRRNYRRIRPRAQRRRRCRQHG